MIDDYDLGSLGERFIRYRLPAPSESDTAMTGLLVWQNLHERKAIRARRSQVVADFFAGLAIPDPRPSPSEADQERASVLANLGARCRFRWFVTGSKAT
jgi:hypothetical protein